MTCIAFDGKSIAADRQASNGNTKRATTKLFRLADGSIATMSGLIAHARTRLRWYEAGAKIEDWPTFDGDDYVCLIVWNKDGLRYWEDGPVAETVEHGFWAFGSGRDFAIAAMACGKSAREAVEIACQFDTGCGLGVDVMTLNG